MAVRVQCLAGYVEVDLKGGQVHEDSEIQATLGLHCSSDNLVSWR